MTIKGHKAQFMQISDAASDIIDKLSEYQDTNIALTGMAFPDLPVIENISSWYSDDMCLVVEAVGMGLLARMKISSFALKCLPSVFNLEKDVYPVLALDLLRHFVDKWDGKSAVSPLFFERVAKARETLKGMGKGGAVLEKLDKLLLISAKESAQWAGITDIASDGFLEWPSLLMTAGQTKLLPGHKFSAPLPVKSLDSFVPPVMSFDEVKKNIAKWAQPPGHTVDYEFSPPIQYVDLKDTEDMSLGKSLADHMDHMLSALWDPFSVVDALGYKDKKPVNLVLESIVQAVKKNGALAPVAAKLLNDMGPEGKSLLQESGLMKMTLTKALAAKPATEDEDGLLTPHGTKVATGYANAWVAKNARDLDLERLYPELAGLFYDIRADAELAHRYADPVASATQVLKSSVAQTFKGMLKGFQALGVAPKKGDKLPGGTVVGVDVIPGTGGKELSVEFKVDQPIDFVKTSVHLTASKPVPKAWPG